MDPEVEYGNIEYKRKLSDEPSRFRSLNTQLLWRLDEGNGVAIYYIGLEDDGSVFGLLENDHASSLVIMNLMCIKCNATIHENLQIIHNEKILHKITIIANNDIKDEKTILILGEDSDKYASKLLYDSEECVNRIYNYEHEQKNGIQSLLIRHIGLDSNNDILNLKNCSSPIEIKERSSTVLSLILTPVDRIWYDITHIVDHVIIIADMQMILHMDHCWEHNIPHMVVNEDFKEKFSLYNPIDNAKEKGIIILSVIRSNEESYLVTALNNDITKIGDEFCLPNNEKICIKSMRYFDVYIAEINKNVIFTALITCKFDIKNYKRRLLTKV